MSIKPVFLFIAITLTLVFSASAQFRFTNNAGQSFSVTTAPQKTERRGGGFVMEFYYTVEGTNLVVYEVGKSEGVISDRINIITVPISKINAKNFTAQKTGSGCYLQTGTPFTSITHGATYNANDKFTGSNLQMNFSSCEEAEALRVKVLGDAADDIDLSDLDLDLSDKPKEKPKSTMPAHLFALIGDGSRIYQLNRNTNEVWDITTNDVVQVGKIAEVGGSLRMLVADESYFTYNVRDGRLYNGDKYLGYKLTDGVVCRSQGSEMCVDRWEIDRTKEVVKRVFMGNLRPTETFDKYRIRGEATDEEILLIFAVVEKLK